MPDAAVDETINGYRRRWWKESVVYQIYPRSFYDSNGDGIGDLNGIRQKLSHIKGLGIDVIWLSPHFDSPNADNGYDIRDYRQVMAEFGTLDDFDALLNEAHALGLRLIIDLVVNHSSDEHAWFAESRKSRDNPYRDYYIWRPGEDGVPNNWTSIFGGPAWTQDAATGDYYLHLFAEKQPDLNWENPALRHEVYDLMRFWLDKGVDGFRMDVIPFISKTPGLPDLTPDQQAKPQFLYSNGPRLHEFLQEMRQKALAPYDTMTVGEAFGVTAEQTQLLVDERRGELDMIFQFDTVEVDRDANGRWRPWTLPELKAIFTRQDAALDRHGWPTVFFSNHDNPRVVSRYGDDSPQWRTKSAKVMATLLLTMKGTPFIYQGDEIGMTNFPFSDIAQFDDLWVKNAWRTQVEGGQMSPADFIAYQNHITRDHSRTPVQWTPGANGGFTAGKPWLAVNPNSTDINVEIDQGDPQSICRYFAELIQLRHGHPNLVYGDYLDLMPDHPNLFAYTRTLAEAGHLIILNFSPEPQPFRFPMNLPPGDMVLTNAPEPDLDDWSAPLRGWEARIYRI